MLTRKILLGTLILVGFLFFLKTATGFAQCDYDYQNQICIGDTDYDCDVDGSDAATFKSHFGRSGFKNPCPPNGPAPVAKTGQTTTYATGDDGDLEKGVPWPNPRFTDNGDGTITDNLTGLTWLKDANCMATHYPSFDNDGTVGDGAVTWQHAFAFISEINIGIFPNCGDGNNDWRLPNYKELISLIDAGNSFPALPTGHPFANVAQEYYWSSTTLDALPGSLAWIVYIDGGGYVDAHYITSWFYVWPVRGGQ
jgi:hypothetical protein